MKYTIREFAQEIRNNYPNDYDDLSDKELVNLWLKKYPKDKNKVNLNSHEESKISLKPNGSKSVFSFKNIFKLIFWIGFISIGINVMTSRAVSDFIESMKDKHITESDMPSSTQTSGIQTFLDNIEASSKEFDNSGIPVNEEAERIVNESQLIQDLNLQQNDLLTLKQILSDTNPDPDSKVGEICSFHTTECKWCSKEIKNEDHIQSYQNIVKLSLSPLGSMGLLFSGAFTGNDKLKKELEAFCNDFRVGKKYLCVEDEDKTFCSKKCETEYKQNR